MQTETMTTAYEPKEVETKWYDYWEKNQLFRGEAVSESAPFCIVIPPPNAVSYTHLTLPTN